MFSVSSVNEAILKHFVLQIPKTNGVKKQPLKVLLKILQNSQQHTWAGISFLKSCRPQALTHVFSCDFYKIFKNILFHFIFYVLHLMTENLIAVSKNNLQWSCWLTFKLERSLMDKLKHKRLNGVFGMVSFFGILKICGFVYLRNFLLQLQSRRNKPTYFTNFI